MNYHSLLDVLIRLIPCYGILLMLAVGAVAQLSLITELPRKK